MKTLALRARVFIHCFLVFGYPGETRALVVHILHHTFLDKINGFESFCFKIKDFPNFLLKLLTTRLRHFHCKRLLKVRSKCMISFCSMFDRRNINLRSSTPDYKLDRGQESISNYFISTNIEHNTSRLASEEELRCWQNFNL